MPAPLPISPPRHLLVIKPSSLGDIVHALQVIQLLRCELPACRVTWVVRDRFAPLVEAAPFVDEVILFHRKEGLRGLAKLLRELRQREFDMIWDMQGLLRSGLMTAAAMAKQKWGRSDAREGSAWFYKRKIDLPSSAGPHHAIAILLEFTKALGIDRDIAYPLQLADGPNMPWSSFFAGDPNEQFVIFTDSRGAGKEWPGFDALTHLIWQEIPNSRIAWCAGSSMQPSGSIPDGRFLNLTGCPLLEMIELVRQPSIFIGNDSGPMHLSAAVGNKVLAIFGPTSPLRFGPWPLDSPRTSSVQAPNGVLANLSAQQVLSSLLTLREK
ncbi:MAG: lipopolysaccharide heptosyltransferase family protein [Verrucomicrobia bacterium]|nr:MAG: lipopolysaccharide heptosyltransferase family protein [Verrucomicrobiota bacterium]